MKQVFLILTILLATLLFFPFSLTQARELLATEKKVDLKSHGTITAPSRGVYNYPGPHIRFCRRRPPPPKYVIPPPTDVKPPPKYVIPPPTYVKPPLKYVIPPPKYVEPPPPYVKPPPPYLKPPCGRYKRKCPPEGH
ncbi:hypothetical protein TIFTF001_051070 [Ficus carica]|uniref:Uncharacterized protein n=1 Tax=Ficus carica TaxID=3494 RepID=A0AA87YXL3_FICCA|nr:hypothetical protein TIFTF001_051069 [Ficus carica]GMN20820.1 hypothetical protein TIFTF001_051070 [Ficus carica]